MKKHWGRKIGQMVAIGIAACAVFGFVVMSLWNWLMPAIFGLRVITFWQALGLVVLSKILFGSFHTHQGESKDSQRRKLWARLTPEQRAKFDEGIQGIYNAPPSGPTTS